MKSKKLLLTISILLINSLAFCQQIGSGYPSNNLTDFNIELPSGFYQGENAAGAVDGGGWNHLLNLRHSNIGNNYQIQIASAYDGSPDRLFFRKFAGLTGFSNPTWNEIATRGINTFNGNQIINGILSVVGNNAMHFSTYGGGLFMSDTSWIRTYGNKNFYHDVGIMRTDGIFQVGPNGDRLTVNETGKVGVGTTTPNDKLEVNGNVFAHAYNAIGSLTRFNSAGGLALIGHAGSLFANIQAYSDASGTGKNLSLNPSGGNVGIGTTNPTNALTVQKASGGSGASGTDGTGGVRVNWSNGYGVALDAWDISEPRWGITSYSGNTPTVILEGRYWSKDAYFNSGGNVGIGTTTPYTKLEVEGTISSGAGAGANNLGMEFGGLLDPANLPLQIRGVIGALNNGSGILAGSIGYQPRTGVNASHIFFNEQVETLRITSAGNVGIGTTDPKNKLSVNGTIWAKEVKVSLTDAADWVFDKKYKLKPLADVEKYINKNKHLPDVPSADEFRQNDMNVSEMSNKLLQKIEELTLYAIEQQKELDRLKTENESYKSLAERLSAIEKELKK